MPPERNDLVVVGAGAAGLYCALTAARSGARVVLVSATPLAQAASYWAQGGLAAALAADDSPERHLADTVAAGRGSVRESAARVLCEEAPDCVRDLERLGVIFDADRMGRLALGLEGGHSVRRVAHAGGSATGRRVSRELSALAARHDKIDVLEGRRGGAIWTSGGRCVGLVCDDGRTLAAGAVVLATGGTAALWSRTTNPPGSVGSGLTLALAAGAALADLELMQFHPTAVAGLPRREGFLITEAIRGEGALLLDAQHERFVDELAPRDEVARAIAARLASSGERAVWLDMRMVDPALFPNVVEVLRAAGVDPQRELVPVAPAAHYLMGGIATDLHGRTQVPGLFAIGECACTGLHGANRLASNSLSECFVFGRRAALAALEQPQSAAASSRDPAPEPLALELPTRETREALWRNAGIERNEEGLRALLAEQEHPLVPMIATSALARRESRGAHRRSDAPDLDPELDLQHVIVEDPAAPRFERWV
ncbi:MAG TPA: FAD-dependent oxidoreductase [Solirubrobacteraceae bacterium]|nr:FAD-dependent oxidoreductase [Solirubrobacteraceae bacterium]